MYKTYETSIDLDDGRTITIETGKLAKQADGSVVVKMGKTMLLATVVSAEEAKENIDFMPLSVDYREKFASAGRYPGGFFKREARPYDNEILISRLVDRVLRPLFPDDFRSETFVSIDMISADKDIIPDVLAGLAASAALSVSDVPFNGPISEVSVARIDGELKINPTFSEVERADINIIVGATIDNVMMVEGDMCEVSEADLLEAIKFAHKAIKPQCQAQLELVKKIGKPAKRTYQHKVEDDKLKELINKNTYKKVYEIAKSIKPKKERKSDFEAIMQEFIDSLPEENEIDTILIDKYFYDVKKQAIRNLILDEGIRLDGRKTDEIRDIWIEIDYLPATHGSAIFTRGETQSLTTVTLGTKLDEKIIDEVLTQDKEKFLLHYNFPPFSTGDARPSRFLSRREIGHGNLAHRALKKMISFNEKENPYSIRIVSDILESNGSSSMATVCAGTLALMDAGIKIKKPVSGIAMGLITDNSGKYAILSDILGDEDHLGDMDFKIAGTKDGITACQMDIKVEGLSYDILTKALEQARLGRLHILEKMNDTISKPRDDYKPHAPRIEKLSIPKEFIGAIIGPGGKIIQNIQSETGTTIIIEEVDGHGIVDIVADNKESIDQALKIINTIVEVPEVGKVYSGKIKSIVSFGAFVEILPGRDGLLHISEIEWRRLNSVDEVLKEGDEIEVKLIDIDRAGKLKLSRKVLLPRPQQKDSHNEKSI